MEPIILNVLGKEDKVYKAERVETGEKKPNIIDLIKKPTNFILAAKSCDGSYHKVHSEIVNILKESKKQITKGATNINNIISTILPDDEIHGKRYLIFDPKKGNKAYLLGDIISALKSMKNIA